MLIKRTVIITFAFLYGLLSLLLFTDNLLLQLIETQKAYYLEKTENFENITFTLQNWNSLKNKEEFRIGNNYYDVKKIKLNGNKVIVVVINDEYENVIKYISKNIFPKDKKHNTPKNEHFHPLWISDYEWESIIPYSLISRAVFFYRSGYIKLHSKNLYRPPCMTWI